MSKIASSATVRVLVGFFLAFLAVLFSTAPLRAQAVSSSDPNFTPSVLTSGLSSPDGVVFRSSTGDLLVSQSGQISTVKATNGSVGFFATQTNPDKVSVRASDGLVAVITQPFGPVVFYSSSGSLQNSFDPTSAIIAAGSGLTVGPLCLAGAVFDTNGNLFVAAGPWDSESQGCFPGTNWGIYEFAGLEGASPWLSPAKFVTGFGSTVVIQDMAFSAARPPLGTLYAIDSNFDEVYEISLTPECEGLCGPSSIAHIPGEGVNPRGIAVDPLLGDIYVTGFDAGNIYRVPAPGCIECDPTAATFATGFTHPLRLDFDTTGNLYVNESGTGDLWKFSRASNATPLQGVTQGQFNFLSFVNPNGAMSDQTQNIMIPSSANLGGTAFIQDIFVSVNPATLNATLANGTPGDPSFFGGTGVPPGTTCIPVPSAGNNCVVVIQKCYDANHNPFAICPVQEPLGSTDLIQLTFGYAALSAPTNTAFLIGFDDGDGNDITDITSKPFDCCTGSGSGKSLCSKTFGAILLGTPNFSISVAPNPVNLTASNSNSATVTVSSNDATAFDVSLGVSDVPPGFSATLNTTLVSVGGTNSSANSTLQVQVSTSTTINGVSAVIANLLASGCIDKSGIANALTSKLSAAQADINAGQIKTAINVLSALNDLVKAQSGKHIAATCTTAFPLLITGTASVDEVRSTTENVSYSPGTLLMGEIQAILTSLKASVSSEDPITGFVVNSSGVAVAGATVSLLDSTLHTLATATTDPTGFYFFATTGTLTSGQGYTIEVSLPFAGFTTATPTSSPFTWMGKGLAFDFTLN